MKEFYYLLKKEMRDKKFETILIFLVSFWILALLYILLFYRVNSPYSAFLKFLLTIMSATHYMIPFAYAFSITIEYKSKTIYQAISMPCSRFMPPFAKYIAYVSLLTLNEIFAALIGIAAQSAFSNPEKLTMALNNASMYFTSIFIALGIISLTSIIIYHCDLKSSNLLGVIFFVASFIISSKVSFMILKYLFPGEFTGRQLFLYHIPYVPEVTISLVVGIIWGGIYMFLYEKYGYV